MGSCGQRGSTASGIGERLSDHGQLVAPGATPQVDAREIHQDGLEALIARRRRLGLSTGRRWRRSLEKRARDSELGRRVARGHEPVVANLDEAGRQHVLQEAAKKCLGLQRDRLAFLGPEGDAFVVHADKALVRDPDTVGVATEVANHLLGATEGAFGVDDASTTERVR